MPLRFTAAGRPAGAFEIYLSYRPVAAAVARDKRMIALLLAIGLALLWAVLYRIVARASRRLRRQAAENYGLARHDPLTGLPNRTMLGRAGRPRRAPRTAPRRLGRRAADRSRAVQRDQQHARRRQRRRGAARGRRAPAGRLRRFARGSRRRRRVRAAEHARCHHRQRRGACRAACWRRSSRRSRSTSSRSTSRRASAWPCSASTRTTRACCCSAPTWRSRTPARSAAGSRSTRPLLERADAPRLKLLGQVRGALLAGEFVLHYQPKVDLRDRRITGVEALVRWQHPELGLLAPDRFIELIEQTSLIGPLTFEVIEQALRQIAAWQRRGIALQVAVNLSARNLLDRDLPSRVAGTAARARCDSRAAGAGGHRERRDGRSRPRRARARGAAPDGRRRRDRRLRHGQRVVRVHRRAACDGAEDRPQLRDGHRRPATATGRSSARRSTSRATSA